MKIRNKGVLFVDGDGNPSDAFWFIVHKYHKYAEIVEIRVYGSVGNGNFDNWCKLSETEDIHIYPIVSNGLKNGVDNKIGLEIAKKIHTKNNIKSFGLVCSDFDYRPVADEATTNGYEIIGFGGQNSPDSLRDAFALFFVLNKGEYLQCKLDCLNKKNGDCYFDIKRDNMMVKIYNELVGDGGEVDKSKLIYAIRSESVSVRFNSNDPNVKWNKVIESSNIFEVCKTTSSHTVRLAAT